MKYLVLVCTLIAGLFVGTSAAGAAHHHAPKHHRSSQHASASGGPQAVVGGAPLRHGDGVYSWTMVENDAEGLWSTAIKNSIAEWGDGLHAGPCTSDHPCIKIDSSNDGANNYWGGTTVIKFTDDGSESVLVDIHLNSYYKINQDGPYRGQEDVTHELGHALGLAHDNYGVMYPYVDGADAHIKPSDAERSLVHKIYFGS